MDHDLLGLFALAALLGARHGFDADHLAAIDAMTRLEMRRRPATAHRTGLWFSAGHGGVVIAIALGVSAFALAWRPPVWLDAFGAWTSIAVLAALGVMNVAAAWRAPHCGAVPLIGWRSAWLRGTGWTSHAARPLPGGAWLIAGIGAAFAVSFDTVSAAALIAVSASRFGDVATAGGVAAVFVLGMFVVDGANSAWIARLLSRCDATAATASRVMAGSVGLVSLGTAVLGAAALLSPAVAGWAGQHGLAVGAGIVALVAMSFALGVWLGAQRHDVGAVQPAAHPAARPRAQPTADAAR